MDGKIVSAFISGAVVASGIVYMAVREVPGGKPAKIADTHPFPQVTAPGLPQTARQGAVPSKPSSAPRMERAPIHEKPSPMPSPVVRKQPVVFARRQELLESPVQPSVPATRVTEAVPVTPAGPVQPTAPLPLIAPEPSTVPPPPETPAAAPAIEPSAPAAPNLPAPEPQGPHMVTLSAGTLLPVRIGETISTARNQPGDSFLTTLDRELVIDGFIIAERGARVEGRVVEAEPAGRARGTAHLGIELVRLSTSDGQRIRVRTEPYRKDGPSSASTDAAKIGAGAAIGAAIGAIAGGGKGAGIGAGVGGAAGTGDVLLTRGKPAEIPIETRLTFRVQESVKITEKLD